ncbi:MAG: class I tRNA ligase family protein, partial [Nanoarchaeota archaeon]|nr:class I tRNA ligase family protein [Nanoarchaeota archaeon]
GFEQRFQNGFDCQGLWVEREEEKDLGLKNKNDIERFGILKFVQACKKRVEKFSKIQRDQSIRLGQWMNWDNSYYTMSDNNNLHNWYLLKKYFDKGNLYKGKDAVPWCWRCGTASSKHDIVTEGYKEVTHIALFMQFPLKSNPDVYFLIFTTTPWTVPANVAIAVNANIDYVRVENEGIQYWLAETRLTELQGDYKIIEKKKGSQLKGFEYIMPYANLTVQEGAPHKVVLWDLASGEEGTGIVHIAPGCGTEDYDLGKKEHLPSISPLNESGFFNEGYEEFSLKKYSDVNKDVIEDLEQRRFVYKTVPYKHRYPHCWRCGEELVFRLVDEWYLKCKEIRDELIKENRKIEWFPEYGKKRQEEWFKNMGDWLISRKRYWGLPLPIWECECGNIEVFGSLEELRKRAVNKKKVDELPELHRPWIDEIKIKCAKCDKDVSRIKDVGDAWLDAGIVPFSTLNYLEDKKYWKEWFPADFICENMPGQYRGWFNALMWASITLAGKTPTKSILGYETLKDEKGQEMHKSKGNAIWFDESVEKIGVDPMRLLYCLQDPAQELRFGFNATKETRNSLNILYNLGRLVEKSGKGKKEELEDKWIKSKFNSLIQEVTKDFESLRPHSATRALQKFWLSDFSRGYIQFVRDRMSEGDEDFLATVQEIYIDLLILSAPIIPFITESIWQELKQKKIVKEESVHLNNWPKADKKKIDKKLEEQFDIALKIIETGMAERDKEKIGLKWPLAEAKIYLPEKIDRRLEEIIGRQLNVKKVLIESGESMKVELDTKQSEELLAEGFAREIARRVQAERKKAGLKKDDVIELTLYLNEKLGGILVNQIKFLKERTNSKVLELSGFSDDKVSQEGVIVFTVRDKNIGLKIFHSAKYRLGREKI